MDHIYEKIRTMRSERSLTLKELAEKTGLSVSFLSQVERSESSIAITSLQKIAEAFAVPITHFFESPSNEQYKVAVEDRKPFRIEASSAVYSRLTGEFPGRAMEPLLITLPPGQDYQGKYAHPGEEFYFILKGELAVEVDETTYRLREGDSIHFPSRLAHLWYNPTDEPAEILCITTPVLFP